VGSLEGGGGQIVGVRIGLEGFFGNLFMEVAGGVFGDVSVVITFHFIVEDFFFVI